MDKTIITWTPENMLTICLMVFVTFSFAGLLARLAHKATAKQAS